MTLRRRQSTPPGVSVRKILTRRSADVCEFAGCSAEAIQTHHRRPRGMGGSRDHTTNLPANLLRLCLDHHSWIESSRAKALELGLLVSAYSDPAEVPVLTRHHDGLVLLDNFGQWSVMAHSKYGWATLTDRVGVKPIAGASDA